MTQTSIQYVSDEKGTPTAVIVPIELWRELASEKTTALSMLIREVQRTTFQGEGETRAFEARICRVLVTTNRRRASTRLRSFR